MPTGINPADDVSRGLTVGELLRKERWFRGPKFVWERETSWPICRDSLPSISNEDPEVKRQVQVNHVTQVEEPHSLDLMIQWYFSWYKLKRGVAWLLRFGEFLKKKRCLQESLNDPLPCGKLSIQELRSAEVQSIKYVQRSSFSPVVKALQRVSSEEPEKKY